MKTPSKVQLHKKSKVLELIYSDGTFRLPAEFLRVYSPSAEVKGHGPGQETLQTGKQYVGISGLESAGNYAIRIIFDDGHDSGIYSWDYLYDLGSKQEQYWRDYLQRLEKAGKSRDPDTSAVRFVTP
ncbi:DUF971 domain-containing protein [Proteobacteria bacterium 005FR1]|nr:DUF971 domain-containing protein [Proteobacteria bacterium 005FR1]